MAREMAGALDRMAALALDRLGTVEADALTLGRTGLAALPPAVAAEVLRQAAARFGNRSPLRAWAHRGLRRVLAAPPPRRPFRLGGVVVEVSGDRVRVGGAPGGRAAGAHAAGAGPRGTPRDRLRARGATAAAEGYTVPRGADRVAFDAAGLSSTLTVRRRRRGDRFDAFGGGERRLKSFLIDAKVPRWERDRLPLVELDGRILWLAGAATGGRGAGHERHPGGRGAAADRAGGACERPVEYSV